METAKEERILVTLVTEICAENGIGCLSLSDKWLLCLQFKDKYRYIFGYNFGVNNATAQMIAGDKAATAQLLQRYNVPTIEHALFHAPRMTAYVPQEGTWKSIAQYFQAHNSDVVCKPNTGTGGHNVIRVQSIIDLEAAVHRLFGITRSICICPYVEIETEYRVYILRGRVEIIYSKERRSLIGDGHSTLIELLMADQKRQGGDLANLRAGGVGRLRDNLFDIPASGERIVLNWRHNLGLGSEPYIIHNNAPCSAALADVATRATKALDIDLAAVDIVQTKNAFMVLEINCGVMMEAFARSSPTNRRLAKEFYEKIIFSALDFNSMAIG